MKLKINFLVIVALFASPATVLAQANMTGTTYSMTGVNLTANGGSLGGPAGFFGSSASYSFNGISQTIGYTSPSVVPASGLPRSGGGVFTPDRIAVEEPLSLSGGQESGLIQKTLTDGRIVQVLLPSGTFYTPIKAVISESTIDQSLFPLTTTPIAQVGKVSFSIVAYNSKNQPIDDFAKSVTVGIAVPTDISTPRDTNIYYYDQTSAVWVKVDVVRSNNQFVFTTDKSRQYVMLSGVNTPLLGTSQRPKLDANGDGVVNQLDLDILVPEDRRLPKFSDDGALPQVFIPDDQYVTDDKEKYDDIIIPANPDKPDEIGDYAVVPLKPTDSSNQQQVEVPTGEGDEKTTITPSTPYTGRKPQVPEPPTSQNQDKQAKQQSTQTPKSGIPDGVKILIGAVAVAAVAGIIARASNRPGGSAIKPMPKKKK